MCVYIDFAITKGLPSHNGDNVRTTVFLPYRNRQYSKRKWNILIERIGVNSVAHTVLYHLIFCTTPRRPDNAFDVNPHVLCHIERSVTSAVTSNSLTLYYFFLPTTFLGPLFLLGFYVLLRENKRTALKITSHSFQRAIFEYSRIGYGQMAQTA